MVLSRGLTISRYCMLCLSSAHLALVAMLESQRFPNVIKFEELFYALSLSSAPHPNNPPKS